MRTEEAYVYWARRYILFHRKRHPADLGVDGVTVFLAVRLRVLVVNRSATIANIPRQMVARRNPERDRKAAGAAEFHWPAA
jgi:hypothetical protein